MTISKSAPQRSKPAAALIPPGISLSCLKGDFDDVFKVFVDLLQNPEFRADKLDIAQKQADDAISRRNDEIGEIAAREAGKLAYGPDNPYVRQPEYATIAAITRQDLIDWHKNKFLPTTSFSASAATSIPPPWNPGCAPHSNPGRKGHNSANRKLLSIRPNPAITSFRKTT